MTARPRALCTAASTSRESVATTTGPTAAASARRSTCAIIGSPAMTASGLPGRRVEAMRAGMRTRTLPMRRQPRSLIRVARLAGNRLFLLLPLRSPPAMNSFELNKILGAVLGTCLALLAVHIAAGAIFTPPVPAKPGYEIAVKEAAPEQPQGKEATTKQPIEALLGTASVERGEQIARQCQICHNLAKGQGPKVGPDLYDIVGRARA